ncbi:hypothetical protein IPZ58_20685 [Streptomyces roseoverticillatus]|uniref:hypothetical protein n=1 Tax=Streptomyces roseoverticillatus TaxID=66429 RepID=UPI001F481100|nr:hypothetical protein [Streptomyces roseoverticillatus]MCF3103989.1 hypothetical protein [Streptomyces roseoverticillatus]
MTEVDIEKPAALPGGNVDRGGYFLFTVVVLVLGWIIAAANTGISYLTPGTEVISIVTGLIGCLVFAVLLRFLHHGWWLAALSVLPSLFVLLGSVEYPREAALDSRGVRETVRITADSADADGSSSHRFTLVGPKGELKETLDYGGDHPSWKVGDRLVVISDPDGTVPLEAASDVDPDGQLGSLIAGVAGWTAITLLAGRRGFVRRRAGRHPWFEDRD